MTNNTSVNASTQASYIRFMNRFSSRVTLPLAVLFLVVSPHVDLVANIANVVMVFSLIMMWIVTKERQLEPTAYVFEPLFSRATNHFYQRRLDQFKQGNYVYVIKDASASGYYKIGKTHLPSQRLVRFSVILPFRIEIMTIIPCEDMSELEAYLHRTYSKYRVNGEWFNLSHIALFDILSMDSNFVSGRIYKEMLKKVYQHENLR